VLAILGIAGCGRFRGGETEPAIYRVTRRTGLFRFSSYKAYGAGSDFMARFFWDEDYFSQPATIYNHSLATMTLAFAMSAFASDVAGIDYQAQNAIYLLGQIGFNDIEVNHYFTVTPHEDSMGVIAAHKDIEANGRMYTLVAVSTRGSGYGIEWAGNFTVGANGYHEGFRRAADETLRFVEDYVNRHRDSFAGDIKFWITGYSRGGAVANMFAAWVSEAEGIAGLRVNRDNIFAYTFSTPRAVPISQIQGQRRHTNIHNVVSPADIVTWVAPYAWGFGRYGVDHYIPECRQISGSYAFDTMLRFLYELDTDRSRETIVYTADGERRHITETFQAVALDNINIFPPGVGMSYTDSLISPFLQELTDGFAAGVAGQDNFATELEDIVRVFIADAMQGQGLAYRMDAATEIFLSKLSLQNAIEIVAAFVTDGMEGVAALAAKYLHESIVEAGIDIDGGALIAEALVSSFTYIGIDGVLTLIHNLDVLAAAHHPEFMLAWLMSRDVNYLYGNGRF